MRPIVVENVSKTFGGKGWSVEALQGVSFDVKKGEIFGLLGPNGAGKTTMINIMLNLLTPDTGSVQLMGERPNAEVLQQINVVSGGAQFHWALNPREILTFFADVYRIPNPKQRIDELTQLLKMEHLMERRFNWLSTGEKLRVAFAKALLNKPKLLLMDEPTLGLDPDVARHVRKEVRRLNRDEGTTILLTSHYMHEVEQLCNRIAFIYKGKIVDVGEVREVKLKRFATYDVILHLDKAPDAAFVKKHSLEVKGTRVKATLHDEEAMSTLLAAVHEAGYRVRDMSVKKPTLEDYFVKILGEQ
jgi:ABC-2 type transport system ATP-binding protein